MVENQPDSSEPLLIRAIEKVNPWLLAVAFHAALIGVAEVAARMDVGDILPRQSPLTDRGTSAESGKSFEYSQKPLEELKKSRATFVEACIRYYFSPGENEKPSLDTFLYADALDTVEMELRHGRTASLSEAPQVSRQLWDSRVDRLLEVSGTWTGDPYKVWAAFKILPCETWGRISSDTSRSTTRTTPFILWPLKFNRASWPTKPLILFRTS